VCVCVCVCVCVFVCLFVCSLQQAEVVELRVGACALHLA
jgi:hypothetical protein